jgi:uncharacterized membrane protein YkoI
MITRKTMVFCATIIVASAALSYASEQPIRLADLPAAVQKTAQEQSKGAVIKRYVKDNEDGQLEYEVEMTIDGHSKDVAIAPDGKLLEVEEQVKLDALPAAVRQGLQKKAGQGAITKVESITKKGHVVAYEAQVRTAGRHSEIQVGPDGQTLQHEE